MSVIQCSFPTLETQQDIIMFTKQQRRSLFLYNVSDLPLHLSKIITCSKQWKDALMLYINKTLIE